MCTHNVLAVPDEGHSLLVHTVSSGCLSMLEDGHFCCCTIRAQLLSIALACRFGIGCVSITELGKDCCTPVILRAAPPLASAQHSAASVALRRAFQVYITHACVPNNQLEWQAPVDRKDEVQLDGLTCRLYQEGSQKLVLACEVSLSLCRLGAGVLLTEQAAGWEPPLTAAISTPQLMLRSLCTW